mmetsp:Transcript_5810/g.8192  ORF Transcript_5810/g.8192 Transcript_5810/m.8192 type:complete len:99 (+) Transcript_5810:78-374(+)
MLALLDDFEENLGFKVKPNVRSSTRPIYINTPADIASKVPIKRSVDFEFSLKLFRMEIPIAIPIGVESAKAKIVAKVFFLLGSERIIADPRAKPSKNW